MRACDAAVAEEPDNAQALALQARLAARIQRVPVDEARRTIESQIFSHPGDTYLLGQRAGLLFDGGDRGQAATDLRALAAEHPDDSYVQCALAAVLSCDRTNWPEAWEHYKVALRIGPLATPAMKSAALFYARRFERRAVRSILAGTRPFERLALMTRSSNAQVLVGVNFALCMIAIVVGLRHFAIGASVMVLTSLWSGWCAVVNGYIGCWKCCATWSVFVVGDWLAYLYVTHSADGPLLVFAAFIGFALSMAIRHSRSSGASRPGRQPSLR